MKKVFFGLLFLASVVHSQQLTHGIEIYLLDCYGELNIVDQNGKLLKYAGADNGVYVSPLWL